MDSSFDKLIPFLNRRRAIGHLISLINYDLSTTCPKMALGEEGDLLVEYIEKYAEVFKKEEFIAAVKEAKNDTTLNSRRRCLVNSLYKDVDFFEKVDLETYSGWTRDINKSSEVWREAKEKNDFALFLPHWKKAIDAARAKAKVTQKEGQTLYDVLLDQYEEGNDTKTVDAIFGPLKEFLVKNLPLVLKKQAEHRVEASTKMDLDLQKKLSIDVLNRIGYDLDRGALRESMHPFSDSLSENDARITTSYSEDDFRDNLYSVIHEGGHAIEFQNLGKEQYEDYSEMLCSSAICETHSRFYENILGRSDAFLRGFYRDYNVKYLHLDIPEDDFIHLVRVVTPSLIRTESDEFTYCLHIIIRYEIERDIINGVLEAEDVPAVWNKKYKEYLGVDVPSDSEGVLQDIHWSEASFGYFPSYALGNIYGAMILERMSKELDLDALLLKGDMIPIREWFVKNDFVHDYLPPREWLKVVTGKEVDVNAFINYLSKRYL